MIAILLLLSAGISGGVGVLLQYVANGDSLLIGLGLGYYAIAAALVVTFFIVLIRTIANIGMHTPSRTQFKQPKHRRHR